MLGSLLLSILPFAQTGTYETIQHPGGPVSPHVAGQFILTIENRSAFPQDYTLHGVAFGIAVYDDKGPIAWTQARAALPVTQSAVPGQTIAFDLTWSGPSQALDLPAGTYVFQRTAYFRFTGSGAYTAVADGAVGARWP